jgi:hypothetical protein
MNIHKYHLFWCEQKGTRLLIHGHGFTCPRLSILLDSVENEHLRPPVHMPGMGAEDWMTQDDWIFDSPVKMPAFQRRPGMLVLALLQLDQCTQRQAEGDAIHGLVRKVLHVTCIYMYLIVCIPLIIYIYYIIYIYIYVCIYICVCTYL